MHKDETLIAEKKVINKSNMKKKEKIENKQNDSSSKIKDLLKFVDETGLEEVYIKTSEITLRIKRNPGPSSISEEEKIITEKIDKSNQTESKESELPPKKEKSENENLLKIKAPMIGTFYKSANPDSPPFVKVGDEITKGQTICIIEAMKLFNEIESEYSGILEKILIEDATPVEYDQPLFLIKPEK